MKFIFTGTGTSQGIPVIGCTCEVCKSTDIRDKRLRTSGILQGNETTLVFDTGPDFRQQMLRHNINVLDAVVFTHQHKDHTAGLDDVRAYNFILRRKMPIYADELTRIHLHKEYYYIFEPTDYPALPQLEINLIDPDKPFEVGEFQLIPIKIIHGRLPILGYRIGKFAYITDASFIPEDSLEKLQGLDVLVLNALRKKAHPSHFTLQQAIEMVAQIQPKAAYFTHISHFMGTHASVEAEGLPEGVSLAYDGLEITID
ncbi:MAG: MBL fold metallo-hydrolase [Bacteroidota bacterium]